MKTIEAILRQHLPSDFVFLPSNENLLIRDSNADRGKGYLIQITKRPRYLHATIEFEDFAKQLIDYAENQLTAARTMLAGLAERYVGFAGKIHRQNIENIAVPEIKTSDTWWLTFEYKLSADLTHDCWNFSDILLCYILLLFPYDVEGQEEGKPYEVSGTQFERNRLNRALCLAFHGYNCKVCNLNMRKIYTGLSNEYIHVHHLNPISDAGINRPDPLKDLVPLCPNCHSVAHMKNPPYTVQEIMDMINKKDD